MIRSELVCFSGLFLFFFPQTKENYYYPLNYSAKVKFHIFQHFKSQTLGQSPHCFYIELKLDGTETSEENSNS